MLVRKAPAGGYATVNKSMYRRFGVWPAIEKGFGGTLPRLGHYALLPSVEGLEIQLLLDGGVMENRLHVIDKNPDIVAQLKRKYPLIQTYPMDAFHALMQMSMDGVQLTACNLDLCGKIHPDFLRQLHVASTLPCWVEDAAMAVTIRRGRERFFTTEKTQAQRNARRLKLLRKAIGVREKHTGEYSNGTGRPFMWAVYKLPTRSFD